MFLVDTLNLVEEINFIALKNEGYPLEIINDVERLNLKHLKIKETFLNRQKLYQS